MSILGQNSEFQRLLTAVSEIAAAFPEGVVFIGGIAVYLHSVNNPPTEELAEFTHDADFYISIADFADLRDLEEVVANRRLNKHQLIKHGFEFDIYTERYSSLIVPYDAVMAHAVSYDTLRAACLEHLIVLKLEAYKDRFASSKGSKDAKDLIRLGLVSRSTKKPLKEELIVGYLSDDHLNLLKQIEKGPEFLALAQGNAKQAKNLRSEFSKAIAGLFS